VTTTAEPVATPTVRDALPGSVRDLLEHPLPLVVANVLWGALAVVAWLAAIVSPPVAVVCLVLLAWPAATIANVAGRVVRGETVGVRDAWRWPVRRSAVAVLGPVAILGAVVGLVDLQGAVARADAAGLAFATVVAWGLVALGVLACLIWPLLGDPARSHETTGALVRLAVTMAFSNTRRVLAVSLVVGAFLAISVVFPSAVLTVSVSMSALVLARVVLPLADTLDPPRV
jgi:hypothetical protein